MPEALGGSATAVALDRVSFSYDETHPIIRSVSLEIRRGRVLAMLGPNGSGKTTLLKLIAGALTPSEGHVRAPDAIGFVPQLSQINFAYSVRDMVLMGRARQIGVFATPSSADEHAAQIALERLGIGALADRSFETLSGGERQLTLFARALASNATVLVLDEPTAALDLSHQRTVLERVWSLCHDEGVTIVMSTHQPEQASAVADDVVFMFKDGRVVSGPTGSTLTAEQLTELFGLEVRRAVVDRGDGGTSEIFVPVWRSHSRDTGSPT